MATYDAIVVGGGVVGASTAYHLVHEGAKTLLIDRRDSGRATDAGAGILAAGTDIDARDPIERFEARAAAYYPVLIDHLRGGGAGDTGYKVCGSLTVAVDEDEVAHFDRIRAGLRHWRAARGDGCAEMTPDEARALFPPLAKVRRALHCAGSARVDGRLLAAALLHVATTRGLEAREARVDALIVESSAVAGVMAAGERFAGGQVVLAAGPGRRRLATASALRFRSSRSAARSFTWICPAAIPAPGRSCSLFAAITWCPGTTAAWW